MAKKPPQNITPLEARLQLWETGELSWKLEPSQKEILSFIKGNNSKTVVVNSSRRLGKCLAEGTEVLTPSGPKPIEKLQIGDIVYGLDSDGQVRPTTVLNVWCNGEREVVDLVNHSKVMATCSEDHVWATTTIYKGDHYFENTVTRDFTEKYHKIARRLINIPCGTIYEPHAYAIAALLGDGCSRQGANTIHISSENDLVPKAVAKVLDIPVVKKQSKNSYTWVLTHSKEKYQIAKTSAFCNYYVDWCKNRYAHEKIVDLSVLNTWDRRSLAAFVAGLIDTDGSVTVSGNVLTIQFCGQSLSVCKAFQLAVQKLTQYKVSIGKDLRQKYKNGPVYYLSLRSNLFSKKLLKEISPYIQTPRKKWKQEYSNLLENNSNQNYVGIKKTNKRKAVTWDITVGNDTNLYLLANGLVTHNSFASCAYAIELCIKKPRSTVKYLAGQQRMVRDIVAEIMPFLLEDCPAHLKPEYKVNMSSWVFPNGSRIQMAGVDNKRHDALRGGSSVACIVDEAAFIDELKYTVQSVLLPTTTTTNGKIVLISTPPESPDHDFVKYIEEAQYKGAYLKKTIYDYFVDMQKAGKEPKRITQEAIQGFIEEYGGEQSTTFQREYLCEIVTETELAIFPEATEEQMKKMIVKDYPRPPYYDPYVAMDIGFKDLTVVLFAYYDFRNDKIVIDDELVMSGPSMTTELLAKAIKDKEELLWKDPLTKEKIKVYKRVSDNNLIVINDMQREHGLIFLPTAKDDKLAAINSVRMNLAAQRYVIHERCQTLIRHMKNGKWNKSKTNFARSPENGHYDACFVPGSKILTKNGFKSIENIEIGEEVLTHKGRFRKVKAVMSSWHEGDLVEIKIKGTRDKILCTKNHPFLVSDVFKSKENGLTGQLVCGEVSWKSAEDLNLNHRLVKPDIIENSGIGLSKEMCFLYGYYVAEGSLSGNKCQIQFAGHVKETNVAKILQKAIVEAYGHYSKGVSRRSLRRHALGMAKPRQTKISRFVKERNGQVLAVSQKELYNELKHLDKGLNKHFPVWIAQLNKEQALYMLLGYLFGDGFFGHTGARWTTISPAVCDGVRILSSIIGLCPNFHYNSRKNVVTTKGVASPQFNGGFSAGDTLYLYAQIDARSDLEYIFQQKLRYHIKQNKHTSRVPKNYKKIKSLSTVAYTGPVYNLEVEEDHSYTVEQFAVHNCDAMCYLTRNIEFSRNPYPKFWDDARGDSVFYSPRSGADLDTPVKKWADSLSNWRKKK